MKKHVKLFSYLLVGSTLLLSCDKDELVFEEELSINDSNFSMMNGKLKFASKEDLAETINYQKNEGRSTAANTFENLYQRGFRSHKPIIDKNNVELISKLKQERQEKVQAGRTDIIQGNDLIGDPFFAAVLNEDKEIIVGESIYKYTPRGLFFSKIEDSSKMRKVAAQQNKFNKLAKVDAICELRDSEYGITEMESGVHRFVRPVELEFDTCGGGGYSGGGSSSGSGNNSGSGSGSSNENPRNSEIGLNQLIQGLDICNGGKENWFQNIFGSYRYCHKYFNDDEFRFELDYWNQEWLVYASVGVEAETHEDGWLWWNNVDSDEIILGINKVHLTYNLPAPDIAFESNYVQNTLNQFHSAPLYMHNGRFLVENNNSIYEPVKIKVLNNTALPFFDIRGENVLNIYLGKYFGQDIGLTNYDIFNESNIKQIYKLGIDFLKKQASSSRKDFVVTVQRNNNTIDVLYFDEMKRNYNTDEVEIKFDSDWSVVLGAKSADGGDSFSIDYQATLGSLDYLGDYKYISVDIYGLARRGNEWKGLRLIMK